MSRSMRARVVPLVLAGAVLALVGGICGYFGIDFVYRLWAAGRGARSSCALGEPAGRCASSWCFLDEARWWVGTAGALAGAVPYVGLGLLAGLPRRSMSADPGSPATPPGWGERVARGAAQ